MKTWRAIACLIAWLVAFEAFAIDINGQLKKADLETSSADPSSPSNGRIYLNTSTNKAKYRSNSAWLTLFDLTGGTVTGTTSFTSSSGLTSVATTNGVFNAFIANNGSNGSSAYTQIELVNDTGQVAGVWANSSGNTAGAGANGASFGTNANSDVTIVSHSNTVAQFHKEGWIDYPNQTSFSAVRATSTDQTSLAPNGSYAQLNFDSVSANGALGWQQGAGSNGYSTTNKNYVVPATGYYLVSLHCGIKATNVLNSLYECSLMRGATFGAAVAILGNGAVGTTSTYLYMQTSGLVYLTSGDTLWAAIFGAGNNGTNTLTMDGRPQYSNFSMMKVF